MHPVQVPCLVSEEEEERRLQSDVSFDIWNEGLEMEERVEPRASTPRASTPRSSTPRPNTPRASTPASSDDNLDLDAIYSPSHKKSVKLSPGQMQVTVLWLSICYIGTM